MVAASGDFFAKAAIKLGLVRPDQMEEAGKLQDVLAGNGFQMSLPEIFIKKEWMTAEQVRAINIYLRYEDLRADDETFATFMIQKGFVSEGRVHECLELQRLPYEKGKTFPRLHEYLLQKGYLSLEQLQRIHRARTQAETGRAPRSGSGSFPQVKVSIEGKTEIPETPEEELPGLPTPVAPVPAPPQAQPTPVPPPATDPEPTAADLESGKIADTCTLTLRRTRFKDMQSRDRDLAILDIIGVLDGHTFKPFEEYLLHLLKQKFINIILNCQKLEYVSSAGIGVLAGSVKRARDASGDLRLCAVPERVKRTLNLVGLPSMLRIYDQEKGAILSFKYL